MFNSCRLQGSWHSRSFFEDVPGCGCFFHKKWQETPQHQPKNVAIGKTHQPKIWWNHLTKNKLKNSLFNPIIWWKKYPGTWSSYLSLGGGVSLLTHTNCIIQTLKILPQIHPDIFKVFRAAMNWKSCWDRIWEKIDQMIQGGCIIPMERCEFVDGFNPFISTHNIPKRACFFSQPLGVMAYNICLNRTHLVQVDQHSPEIKHLESKQ